MSRFLIIFLSFILLLPAWSLAQTNIRGVVLNYANEARVGGAEIANLRTGQRVESNGLGIFNIAANTGDTLRVAMVGFNEQQVQVRTEDDLIIRLKGITELRAVNVYGITKQQEHQGILEDYRSQGSYYDGKPSALAYIFTPISALHERFGKTGKRIRRFKDYMSFEQGELLVERKFNIGLVGSLTGLKDTALVNFMQIYRPSADEVSDWNEYDATSYIKRALEQYQSGKRPQRPSLPKVYIPELSREK